MNPLQFKTIIIHHPPRPLGLGLLHRTSQKKKGPTSPKAGAGQENIETVHEPKPTQTKGAHWRDKVAVLWRTPLSPCPQDVKENTPSR
jgi:hypothetical protein